jgi:F420-dependent oxidoreductase-like protein
MRLSTAIGYDKGFKEAIARVKALEHAGLDTVWVAEAYGFDSVSIMGYLAAETERVTIASGILPIYTRTPALLAMTAAGMDYVSDGRFVLGLGASGPQVIEGFHGVPYDKPVGRTREIISICRKVWKREVLTNEGIYPIPLPPEEGSGLGKPLKIIPHPVRSDIPIYVAALGDANVKMTAEVADGWLPILFVPEKAGDVWGDSLRAGAAERSADRGPLQIAAGGAVAVGDDVAGLRDLLRPMIALYVGGMGARGKNFYNSLAQRYGWVDEARTIQDLYLDGKKDQAAAAIPAEFVEKISLIGPAGYVKERLAAFKEAGVTELQITPLADDPVGLVEQLRGWVDDL